MKTRLRTFAARLASLLTRGRLDVQLNDEIQAHLDLLVDEYTRRGMSIDDARAAARREFGGIDQIKEVCRDQRGPRHFDALVQDLRYAVRALRKDPAFAAVAVTALAAGIGASSAIYTQMNAVFWKTLAVKEAEQLRILSWTARTKKAPDASFPYATYVALRDRATGFASLACSGGIRFPPLAEWGPVRIQLVSGNYFQTLGVEPVVGRAITADDDRPGASLVAVVSHGLWQRVHGGDPGILNRTIAIRGAAFQVVGVMPPGFGGLDPMDPREVMIPFAAHAVIEPPAANVSRPCGFVVGRIQAGVSDDRARAEADAVFAEALLINPPKDAPINDAPRVLLTDMAQHRNLLRFRERASTPLLLLLSTVSVILLVVCANIAGLLLARGQARRKEIATRLAIGARRGRIVQQLLTESVLLSLIGGAIGIGMAYALNPRLPGLLTQLSGSFTLGGENPTLAIDLSPDARVLAVSVAVTVGAGILFGLWPAVRTSRLDLASAMKQTPAVSTGGRAVFGSGKALVVVQVAFSMLLLVGAGLLIRTFLNLRAVPMGYEPDRLLFVIIDPYDQPRQFVEDSVARLHAVPGVAAVSASMWPLYNNGGSNDKLPICIPGFDPGGERVDTEQVLPRFFETWGVRLLQGRDFAGTAGERVAIVNQAFVGKFLAGRNALGQTIGTGGCPGTPRTIVGVAANHMDRQRAELVPMVYVPYPSRGIEPTTLAIRTAGDPGAMIPAIRRVIAGLGTRIDGDVTTGVSYRNSRFVRERMLAGVLSGFGSIALCICCLGVYGLLTYTVTRRTAEIGLRMALGARRPDVMRLVIRESLGSVAAGIAVGLIAALALTRFVESTLFGVSNHDPWSIAGAAVLMLLTAVAAAFAPARRAALTDPMTALRQE